MTSFYGSSCASNGKDALNTPEDNSTGFHTRLKGWLYLIPTEVSSVRYSLTRLLRAPSPPCVVIQASNADRPTMPRQRHVYTARISRQDE
eukprot:4846339-Pyramimonas_sp.AAC.1